MVVVYFLSHKDIIKTI